MLLLYQPSDPLNADGGDHLHSTMLLLYRRAASSQNRSRRNLHSTMLLLYPSSVRRLCSSYSIYIPLCFYFIPASGCMFAFQGIFTFHYASTLSDPCSYCFRTHFPFTFHYASTLSKCLSEDHRLYPIFTFHYASTLSGYSESKTRRIYKFTFHYASTLSCWPSWRKAWPGSYLHSTMLLLYQMKTGSYYGILLNLHSTMLLLYRSAHWRWSQGCWIYIPLCFYFIFFVNFSHSISSKFTFHYASTLSESRAEGRIWPHSFTFHYASTLSLDCIFPRYCFYRFTFHYASTLSKRCIIYIQYNKDLHSTMLLLYL